MSDRNNITLPREVVVQAVKVLSPMAYDTWPRERNEVVEAIRTALAAPEPKPHPLIPLHQSNCALLIGGYQCTCGFRQRQNKTPPALAAPRPEPEPVRHPGYVIGNHWLETAYERVCAGEAEADVLKDCGWRRDAERDEAVKAEREACAKVCEALANDPEVDEMAYRALREADEAIRARGEVPR